MDRFLDLKKWITDSFFFHEFGDLSLLPVSTEGATESENGKRMKSEANAPPHQRPKEPQAVRRYNHID